MLVVPDHEDRLMHVRNQSSVELRIRARKSDIRFVPPLRLGEGKRDAEQWKFHTRLRLNLDCRLQSILTSSKGIAAHSNAIQPITLQSYIAPRGKWDIEAIIRV